MPDDATYAELVTSAQASKGLLTLAQAAAAGVTEAEGATLVRRGSWEHVAPGLRRIVACPADDDEWRRRVREAVLRAGPGAVAAGHTAARLLGLDGSPATGGIWLAVPPDRHPEKRPGIRVMRTPIADPGVVIDGIPTTGALRAVMDSSRYAAPLPAICLIESAVHQGQLTLGEVWSNVSALTGRRGSVAARAAVRRVDLRSESPLETRARLLLVDAGLRYPRPQQPVGPGDQRRIDLAYLAPAGSAYRGLAIEIDGREFHARAEAFHLDPIRQTALEEAGWLVRRFTSRHLADATYVIRTVRRALQRAGCE